MLYSRSFCPYPCLAACGGSESSSDAAAATEQTFTRDNWAELAADPDAFEGAGVDIVGQVMGEPQRDGDVTYWQMWPHPTNVDWFAVVGFEDPSFTIADGDYVHVLGTVRGKTEGEIPFLATLDAVAVRAETAEVVDESALAPPALRTVEPAQSIEQHGLVVTVDKVEFAANETRVFVTVEQSVGRHGQLQRLQDQGRAGADHLRTRGFHPLPVGGARTASGRGLLRGGPLHGHGPGPGHRAATSNPARTTTSLNSARMCSR